MDANNTPTFAPAAPGIVVTDISNGDSGYSVTVQADGKIVVAGSSSVSGNYSNFTVVRYNTDGSLDTSFNGTGKLLTAIGDRSFDAGHSVTMQADGKIVVAGSSYSSYSSNGSFEDFAVVRYNTDGSLDTSFNGTGKLVTDIAHGSTDSGSSVTMQADGKIVVAGHNIDNFNADSSEDFVVVRYNTDGSLDTSFNGTGKLATDIGNGSIDSGNSVIVQADGKIVVAGRSYSSSSNSVGFAVVRYNTDGSLDTSFNGTGKLLTNIGNGSIEDVGSSVIVQADGKIVVAGSSRPSIGSFQDFAVVRYNVDGTLDTSFGTGGKLVTDIHSGSPDAASSIIVQADGKIVVAGTSYNDPSNSSSRDFAVVRYNADGTLDTSFGTGGKTITDISGGNADVGSSVTVQADGKIVVAGTTSHSSYSSHVEISSSSNFAIVRYNVDGTLDTLFGAPVVNLLGDANNNTLYPTLGSTQSVDGLLGTDTVVIAATRAQIAVHSNNSGGFSVQHLSDGATLNLAQVERLTFTDGHVALDVTGDGHAGQAVKLLGALGGPQLLTNKTLVGDVIRMLDSGYTSEALAEIGLQALGAQTPTQVVQLLWTNLIGRPASEQELQPLVELFSQGISGSQLALMASNLELNTTRIGLTGLAETGIDFL